MNNYNIEFIYGDNNLEELIIKTLIKEIDSGNYYSCDSGDIY